MGKKIFISYKYADNLVEQLPGHSFQNTTTVRDYVDILQNTIDKSDHINKGEDDGEDMSSLADSTISTKLGDKIFDSSVTIVFISKGMKESKPEKDQWIPWEISYSLKEQSRSSGKSKTNAVLAVVLPDKNGSYEYFITNNKCGNCSCRIFNTDILFEIIKQNMFNQATKQQKNCSSNNIVYTGNPSYIYSVEWEIFIKNIDIYIEIAVEIWKKRTDYIIKKQIRDDDE
jgi:hypothetical protein